LVFRALEDEPIISIIRLFEGIHIGYFAK
jgi:hypothetical protein